MYKNLYRIKQFKFGGNKSMLHLSATIILALFGTGIAIV